MQTLAEFLGASSENSVPVETEKLTAESFAEAVVQSPEFRKYIVNSLLLGSLPPAVIIRIMDLAGWTKPPERIEHTGKDGAPIETVTEVRRVVVHATQRDDFEDAPAVTEERTH